MNKDRADDDQSENTINDAKVILDGKLNGFSREGPHSKPIAKPVVQQHTCKKCKKVFKTKPDLTHHMSQHINDGDWNCDDCPHQTNTKDNLKRHLDATHHKSKHITIVPEKIPCNLCASSFDDNTELEKHRRGTHKTFKPCRNLPKCPYENSCLFNHNVIDSNNFLCYECGLELHTFRYLMFHRKNNHTMNKCLKFSDNNCKFTDESCWYNHSEVPAPTRVDSQQGFWDPIPPTDQPSVQPSGFRDPPVNLAPPSAQPTQAAWLKMISMMENLNQMMEKMKETNQFQ